MESEANRRYYLIESSDYDLINRIWFYAWGQEPDIIMYKTRITISHTGWVVECTNTKYESMFLLQFGSYVNQIGAPYYC